MLLKCPIAAYNNFKRGPALGELGKSNGLLFPIVTHPFFPCSLVQLVAFMAFWED